MSAREDDAFEKFRDAILQLLISRPGLSQGVAYRVMADSCWYVTDAFGGGSYRESIIAEVAGSLGDDAKQMLLNDAMVADDKRLVEYTNEWVVQRDTHGDSLRKGKAGFESWAGYDLGMSEEDAMRAYYECVYRWPDFQFRVHRLTVAEQRKVGRAESFAEAALDGLRTRGRPEGR